MPTSSDQKPSRTADKGPQQSSSSSSTCKRQLNLSRMGEKRPVEMVRLEQPEEVYEVEAVFGRDATSVFPNMNKDDDPMEALKASIGAKRFVSETELEEMKKARGLSVDDGTAAADRPLAEILAERKKAKQDAFEDQWKQMKTGKNRPLDPEEYEFLDMLAQSEAEAQHRVQSQEQAELEAFRQAVAAAAAEAKTAAAADADADAGLQLPGEASGRGGDAAAGPGPGSNNGAPQGQPAAAAGRKPLVSSRASSKPLLPVLKPVVKVKPKGAAEGSLSEQRDSKRLKVNSGSAGVPQQQPLEQSPAGLEGLLGGYASDSD